MLSWLRPSTAFSAHASGPVPRPGPVTPRLRPSSSVPLGLRPSAQRPAPGPASPPVARRLGLDRARWPDTPSSTRRRGAPRALDPNMPPAPGTPTRDRIRRPDRDSTSRSSAAQRLPRTQAWAGVSTRRPRRSPSSTNSVTTGPWSPLAPSSVRSSKMHPRAHLVASLEAGRTASETSRPPDQVRSTHERETQVSRPRRRVPVPSRDRPAPPLGDALSPSALELTSGPRSTHSP
jgi:pyruvate/2-oxoglutarate dehydrogenase complex dihydrolipoamide acyltransferase (E2) component